jgi:NAD(P)-dependent dehydrogenase (short-subunit alcohol dehydrogenase family)
MRLGLEGAVVLVTGGSKGIGLACAEAFAAEGAQVAIASRKRENLAAAEAQLAKVGRAVAAFAADLRDPAAASQLVTDVEARVGPIRVLVNCAGAAKRTNPDELDAKAWHDGMDAKYFTYVHAMQAVLPGMKQRGRGAIVNVVGQGGKIASPAHLPGGSANAALLLASTGLAAAYGRSGIRVNVINPGRTLTDRALAAFEADARRLGIPVDEVRRRQEEAVPLGRFGTPEDVANVAVFLASECAGYVTGVAISMDGGLGSTIL